MAIELNTPGPRALPGAAAILATWQRDGAPIHLHPGDLGWFWRHGPEATAAAVRTWTRGTTLLALGLLDGPGLIRLAIAPSAEDDDELARAIAADLADPAGRVLPPGDRVVESRTGARLRTLLRAGGWELDEPWASLRRDLTDPVPEPDLRVEATDTARAPTRVEVHRAAFADSSFTLERWHAMAAGPLYAMARCLVGHDRAGTPVAAATVWSAGPGRPGVLEPVGVHSGHRGRGHGTAITLAAAAALRDLGSSSAIVATPSANTAAVATYTAAGFDRLPDSRDLRLRPGR